MDVAHELAESLAPIVCVYVVGGSMHVGVGIAHGHHLCAVLPGSMSHPPPPGTNAKRHHAGNNGTHNKGPQQVIGGFVCHVVVCRLGLLGQVFVFGLTLRTQDQTLSVCVRRV